MITQSVLGHSYFTWQLARRGVSLEAGPEIGVLRTTSVEELMHRRVETVTPAVGLPKVREQLALARQGQVFVVDEGGRLQGTIALADLGNAAFDTSLDPLLKAIDVMRRQPPALAAHDDIETAVGVLSTAAEPHVAVVDNHEDMKLVGSLNEHDAMLFHSRAVAAARKEERGGR